MKATPDPGVAAFPGGKPKPRPIERLHEHQKQVRERESQQTAAGEGKHQVSTILPARPHFTVRMLFSAQRP